MKFLAKIIIAATIFLLGFYAGQHYIVAPDLPADQIRNREQGNEQTEELISVSLMIDYGNGEVKTFSNVEMESEATVFKLLEKVTRENNIKLGHKDYGNELGVLIESLGEAVNNSQTGHYWQYWVNNSYAQVVASNYQLKKGDIVEWKYIKGQFN